MESPQVIVPKQGQYIWDWFWELSDLRVYGEGGPLGLAPAFIRDWADITGTLIRREEYTILFKMDVAFLTAWREEAANNAAIMQGDS